MALKSPQLHLGSASLSQAPLEQSPSEISIPCLPEGELGGSLNSFLFNGPFLVLLLDSHLRAWKEHESLQEAQITLEDLP